MFTLVKINKEFEINKLFIYALTKIRMCTKQILFGIKYKHYNMLFWYVIKPDQNLINRYFELPFLLL